MKNNIITCRVGSADGPPPLTLAEYGVNRIVGRKTIDMSTCIGSYGMGGPGFFGLCLAKTESFPEEWLILTLWGATSWLQLDGVNIGQKQIEYAQKEMKFKRYRAWIYYYKLKQRYDDIYKQILGYPNYGPIKFVYKNLVRATISDAAITDKSSQIHFRKGNKTHSLEVVLPFNRTWNDKESHLKAWAVSSTKEIDL